MDGALKSFVKCSAANRISLQDQNEPDLSTAIVWNNEFVCIGGKSVYFRNIAEKGVLRVGDLISDNNEFIVKSNYKLSTKYLAFRPCLQAGRVTLVLR